MPIPERVREEAAAAEAQLQALAASGSDVPPTPAPPEPAPPQLTVVPPAPAPAVTPTTPETELQRLQQQLSTEAGRRAAQDAEVAELRGRLRAMQEVITAQSRTPTPAAPAPTPPPSLITDEDRKDFGEDMIDFVTRVIQQTVGNALSTVNARLVKLEGGTRQIEQQVAAAAKTAEELEFERYIGQLDQMVPGWRETNNEDAFVAWLQKPDTFSRKTRHELLANAHSAADAETVAEFFRAYWKENGTAAPAPTPAPVPPPAPSAAPSIDPASLVAPTPSSAPAPAANPRGGKLWTQAEIEAVYDDRMKKRISAEDFAIKEKEIEQAVIEGRVIG